MTGTTLRDVERFGGHQPGSLAHRLRVESSGRGHGAVVTESPGWRFLPSKAGAAKMDLGRPPWIATQRCAIWARLPSLSKRGTDPAMAAINVEEHFRISPAQLWTHVTDAELLQKLGGCDSIQPIEGCSAGLFAEGAVREVRVGRMVVVERVVNVKKEQRIEIEVLKIEGPILQDFERMELIPRGEGCDLSWTIEFRLRTPVLQPALSRIVAVLAKPRFKKFLRKMRTHVEGLHADDIAVGESTAT